ncbi:MAG TPA: efflux RND transporter periplasmic adaptor subunit [Archangium sp.]|nr:efflux RND transporter periplasmic adaptor subunit [Archangium sp.]
MSSPPRSCRPALLGFLSAAVLVLGCNQGAAPPAAPGAVPVTVVTLKSESVLLTRELPGRTSAFLVAEVRPQVNGIIERRLFTEGSLVKAGQPLYQLSDAAYRADHLGAQAALDRAKATLTVAELNAKRSTELAEQAVVSPQDHERAVVALRQAEAEVKAAQAALQRASVTLDHARIVSPISGRIGRSSVTQGALVTANQPQALTSVQQLDPVYVDLTQSSGELLRLRKEVAAGRLETADGTPVTILLEDGSRHAHAGKLTFSDVSVDPSTGTFGLRVLVPNPDNILLPGMYVRARIGNGVREEGLLVPQQGVARDPKGHATALVVGKDGKVEARVVKVSQTVGTRWLVEEGLVAGDRVIVEGLQKVQPGAQVEVTEAAPEGARPGAETPTMPVPSQP